MHFTVGLISGFEVVLASRTVVSDVPITCFKEANLQQRGLIPPSQWVLSHPWARGAIACPLGTEDRQGHATEGAVSFTAGKKYLLCFPQGSGCLKVNLLVFHF